MFKRVCAEAGIGDTDWLGLCIAILVQCSDTRHLRLAAFQHGWRLAAGGTVSGNIRSCRHFKVACRRFWRTPRRTFNAAMHLDSPW